MTETESTSPGDDAANFEIDRVCSILESVTKNYPPTSDEALAIRDAAAAFTIVHSQRALKRSYESLVAAFGGELTEERKADLRSRGLDLDELEDAD